MRFSQSIKPISFFVSHAAEILRSLDQSNNSTIIITQNGVAKAALISILHYENIQEEWVSLRAKA
jgi:prevent-host-death family protein